MWSSELNSGLPQSLEDWIRSADRTPEPACGFRQHVLTQALHARARGASIQRVQVLTTALLAVAMLVGLPGYYHGLRLGQPGAHDDSMASMFSRTALAAMAEAGPLRATDDFEWSLVQAEFAVKDHWPTLSVPRPEL